MATKKTTTRPKKSTKILRSTKNPLTIPRGARSTSTKTESSEKATPSKRVRKTQKKLSITQVKAPPLEARNAPASAQDIALIAVQAGLDKKALDVEILDVASKVDYTDILVLMTGTSDRHVASIVQAVETEIKRIKKLNALSVEGLPAANWVLADFGDVVVHVFQEQAREGYDIGRLWSSATRIPLPARIAEVQQQSQ